MNIQQELLREHSKEQSMKIAAYIGSDTERFDELMQLFMHGEYRINQRAAWVVSHCADHELSLVKPYMSEMADMVIDTNSNDATKRNILRIFQDMELSEEIMEKLLDPCFTYLGSPKVPAAIRVFSMTVLFKISQKFPELQQELRLVIEAVMPDGSAGIKSRGRRTLKLLGKSK